MRSGADSAQDRKTFVVIVVPRPTRDMNSLIKEGSSKWVVVSESDPIFCLLRSMFDVGGQRDERRKWIQCFNGETFRLFVLVLLQIATLTTQFSSWHMLSVYFLLASASRHLLL